MAYYIDLKSISLDTYSRKLSNAYLPPSRKILRENTEERFGYFKNLGINNIDELLKLLKKKDKFAELQKTGYFPGDHLTILLRELNSTLPKPTRLKDFVGIPPEVVACLEKIEIKDTFRLYDKIITPSARKKLSAETGIKENEILELTKLTDISRIKWAGATFARMLVDLGIDSAEKIANMNPEELHRKVNEHNRNKQIFKGTIGLNDMFVFVEAAKEVPVEIEY